MSKRLLKSEWQKLFYISLATALVFTALSFNYLIAFGIVVILVLYPFINEKLFVLLTIIVFISIVGGEVQEYRDLFTVFALIMLIFYFLKRFGFEVTKFPKPPTLINWLVAILLGTIFISSIISGLHSESLNALLRAVIFFFICYFYYAFLASEENKNHIYYLLFGLFFSSLILSATVYYELARSGSALFFFDILVNRWAGTFGNPNSLALLISINIVFVIVVFYSKAISYKIKFSILPLILLNYLIILFLTNSRAAILSLVIAILFLFYHLQKRIIFYFLSIILLFFVAYLFIPFIQELVDTYLRLETVSQRDYLWKAGLDIMRDYPIFGVGPEQYPKYFYSYIPTSGLYLFNLYAILQKPHPHNYSLWLIAENGILGWLSSLVIFGFYFFMASKLIRWSKADRDENYLFAVGLFSVGLIVFIRSFFEVEGVFSYGFISRDLPFWISYIILAYLYKIRLDNFNVRRQNE
ncbi:MAG: O-antigen ligase family protein [Ignavibacterium sp.]|uniref:O-antigen ligase family protein n=1 Tax=Ignavibacterium sp. TaxID=2651167 RepID=UPI0040497AA5